MKRLHRMKDEKTVKTWTREEMTYQLIGQLDTINSLYIKLHTLSKYARHIPDCKAWYTYDTEPCTCGLSTILEEAK